MTGLSLALVAAPEARLSRRQCYRCRDCLSAFAIVVVRPERLLCACGGRAEWLGVVRETGLRSRCSRIQELPTVDIQRRDDGVHVALNPADLGRRDEYRAALSAATARVLGRLGDAWGVFQTGGYLDDADVWAAAATAHRLLHDAKTDGCHARRMALLASVAPGAES